MDTSDSQNVTSREIRVVITQVMLTMIEGHMKLNNLQYGDPITYIM